MNNQYLQYTSKDYNSIYRDLISAIPSLTDSWTCTEDGDPGIVMVKLMSTLGDMLSYNMDKQALEYYASTVTQRKNAAKLFELIGYKMHWYQSATNTVEVTNTTKIPEIYNYIEQIKEIEDLLQLGTISQEQYDSSVSELLRNFYNHYPSSIETYKVYYQYDSQNGTYTEYTELEPIYSELVKQYNNWATSNVIGIQTWIDSDRKTLSIWGDSTYNSGYIIKPTTSQSDGLKTIMPGQTITLDIIQGTLCSTSFTLNQLRDNKFYFSESTVDENHIWLKYANSQGTVVDFIPKTDNLLTVTDAKVYFEFKIDEFDIPYIELSSYAINSLDIADGATFTLYYVRTDGIFGNITSNYLKHIETIPQSKITIQHPANNSAYINTDGYLIATPGRHPETAPGAYSNSMNYVTTFNTLVTLFDFERFVKRQQGISNCYAVDGQRALDLNELVELESNDMSLAQLQAIVKNSISTDIVSLRDEYRTRKYVRFNDYNLSKPEFRDSTGNVQEIKITLENGEEIKLTNNSFLQSQLSTYLDSYSNYGLNLHVVYGNFDTTIQTPDGTTVTVAEFSNTDSRPGISGYWSYKILTDYDVSDNETSDTYEDVITCGSVSKYLDHQIDKCEIVITQPNYSPVRVFPWRCCGVIHLTQPVTIDTANQILSLVINNLTQTFHPSNLTFGKKIAYMDVIKAVTESSSKISYFDAGLGDRRLIDLDKSVDESYFNDTSLMYYYQTMDNNSAATNKDGTDNQYYKLLSISPEYIIQE